MGADLIATVVPKLTEAEYQDAVDNADALAVARAAFLAGCWAWLGDDAEFAEHAAELIGNRQPEIIAEIAAHAGAVEAIRAAAANGVRYLITKMTFGNDVVCDASQFGGPEVIVVGGASFGDEPFAEFRDVAVLAAILVDQTGTR